MKFYNLLLGAFLLSFSACTQMKVIRAEDSRPLLLTAMVNRYGELEPCGCSLSENGGLVREAHALEELSTQYPTNRLVVSVGDHFIPEAKDYVDSRRENYGQKAKQMIEGLNVLAVNVVAPGARDFALGLKEIDGLKRNSSAAWVTTNLYRSDSGKPIYESYIEITYREEKLLLLSAVELSQNLMPEGILLKRPAEAIREVMKEQKGVAAIILLSNLAREEAIALLREFPAIRIVVGGKSDDPSYYSADQLKDDVFYLNPTNWGRALGVIEIPTGKSSKVIGLNRKYEKPHPILSSIIEKARPDAYSKSTASTKE